MWEKCVQILYSSINNSKICPKLTKPLDSMGRIRTAYLLCTRITLEITALRVIWTKPVDGSVLGLRKAGGKPATWLPPGELVER